MTECGRRTLATGAHCKLDLCACGTVYLNIGPLTLRLDPETIRSISETLVAAVRELPQNARRLQVVEGGQGPLRPY